MKIIFLIVIILLCTNISPAQNHGSTSLTTRIDSLKNELNKAQEDTSKLNLSNNLSKEFVNANNYKDARKYANQAIALADKLISQAVSQNKLSYVNQYKKTKANTIHLIALCYHNESNYKEALKNYSASLKIREEIGDKPGIAGSNNNIGAIHLSLGNYTEALKKISASLKIKEEMGDRSGVAMSYNNIGAIYIEQGNYPEALKNFFASLKIKKEMDDQPGIATAYNNIGVIYNKQGNFEEGLKNHLASLKIAEEIGDKKGIAASYGNIGESYSQLGNYSEAMKNYSASLKLSGETGDKETMANAYSNIGIMNHYQGNYTEALKNHTASLKIYEEIKNPQGIANSYNNIGAIYSAWGNYSEALKSYSASSKIFEELGDNQGISDSYVNIGNIYYYVGNYAEALKNDSAALKIRQEIGDKKGIALSYDNIGIINVDKGTYKEALKNHLAALKIQQETGDTRAMASSYNLIGEVYYKMSYSTKNIPRDSVNSLCSLAMSYHRKSLKLSDELGAKIIAADAWGGLGDVLVSLGQYDEALRYYFLDLDLSDSLQLLNYSYKTLQHISNIYSATGKYTNALSYSHQSFNTIKYFLSENLNSFTENDKASFKNSVTQGAGDYFTNAYFIKSGFSDSLQWLYNYQLFQRGIVLESSSGLAASVQQDTSLKELWSKFSGYKNIIGNEYLLPVDERKENLAALEDSANNLERELLAKSIHYRNWRDRVNATWQDVQKHLGKDEAAVEFVSFELQRKEKTDSILYAALVLTPQMSPKLLFLFEEKQLAGLLKNTSSDNTTGISNLYTAMRGVKVSNSSPGALQFGDSLYKLIWQPLAPYLENVKTISFVPDGLLNKINMAAIPAPDATSLCNKYQLRQMATTRSIAFPFVEPKSQPAAFFGGIDYTYKMPAEPMTTTADNTSFSLLEVASRGRGNQFTFLKGSKEEAEGLSNLYKAKKYEYHLIDGKNATEKTFKQLEGKSPAVLHIATHGFFFPSPEKKERHKIGDESNYSLAEDPLLRSGLALAGGNYAWKNGTNPYEEEDGILTAYEISHLNLSTTDLVVLSACETGLGDIKGSEGVYGLQRAFKTAGVKYIIMSLWQVPDKETQEFMQTFYQKWLNGKPIRSAFRETQQEMSSRYEPYQWAAFVLVE